VVAVSSQGQSLNSLSASASAQSVANGGFEYPGIGANYQYVPTDAYWTFTGTNGNGAGILGNGSGFSNPNAPEGAQAAFAQSNGAFSQVIAGFVPGATYAVLYSAAQRSGSSQNGGESWNVTIDNNVIQSNAPGSPNYTDYTASFVATAATHALAFVGTDLAGGDNTVFLDNVRVTQVPPVIANYSFEVPSIGGGNYQYNPTGASWTFTGASPNGSGLVANGSGFSNPNAPLGGQSAFVQEHGTISQTITGFKPGTNYVLTYAAAQRPGNSQSWNVLIDSTVIQANSPGGASFATYTAVFKATATSHKLTFAGTDLATGDNTVFIDDVSITSPPQPVAPVVTLTIPTNISLYTTPTAINLTATVVTNGNLISSVQFYANATNLIGQAGGPPYSYNWINPDTGYYTVFARVTYNGGSVMDSPAARLTVVSANVNFSFELPSLGLGNFQYNPSGGAWAFGGSSGNGSGIVANGSPFDNPNAPLGTQAAFVQGYGALAQTLTGFTPGVTYTLTFSAAQRGSVENGGESWNVLLDNSFITNFPPGGASFAPYSATFTATAAVHTLSFVGTDLAGGDNTVFLDNLQIVPPIPPVAPVITLTAPANNSAYYSPATVNLAATVAASNNQINSVGFFYNTTNLITQVTNPPYLYTWNNVGTGNYTLQARVNYNNVSSVTSPAVNLTVYSPPQLTASLAADGVFTLQFPAVNDLNYVVETSTNLTGWTPIFTNALTPADGGIFIYTNPSATEPARFYRVSQ
jgi:hypothetical protein